MSCFLKKKDKFICSICLDNDNDNRMRKLNCGHKFHYSCIEEWLQIKKVCPLCNSKALPLLEQLQTDFIYIPNRFKALYRLYC